MTAPGGMSLGRLRVGNPYTAVASMAARNPRAAMMAGGGLLAVFGMALLIALSSIQAFLMISQQSASNTQNRFSLVVSGSPDGDGAAGQGPAIAAGAGDPGPTGGTTDGSPPQPTGTVGPEDVTSVRGIRVHRSIAGDIRALLDAAEADGVNLSGWGWRDGATQIRLRREHCGTSDYAVYRMPSSQCRPPTARPGRSQHERGLAIDFTYNGGSIGSRRSPGFKWLNANAATYGLKNLASEPWHWSTTGR